jgi:DNA replication protein DnaC
MGHPDFGKLWECPDCNVAVQRRLQAMKAISSLRGEMLGHTFKNFRRVQGATDAYIASTEFAKEPKGWLVIYGINGNGKTHLAAAIANQLLAKGKVVLFLNVPELLDYLRDAFNPKRDWDESALSYEERFTTIKTAPVLILDDFGAESETAWANEKLYQLLNYRTDTALPTVITTNLKLEDFEERLHSRLANRLIGKIVKNAAPDFRRAAGEEGS